MNALRYGDLRVAAKRKGEDDRAIGQGRLLLVFAAGDVEIVNSQLGKHDKLIGAVIERHGLNIRIKKRVPSPVTGLGQFQTLGLWAALLEKFTCLHFPFAKVIIVTPAQQEFAVGRESNDSELAKIRLSMAGELVGQTAGSGLPDFEKAFSRPWPAEGDVLAGDVRRTGEVGPWQEASRFKPLVLGVPGQLTCFF